jgi:hypothetical protein
VRQDASESEAECLNRDKKEAALKKSTIRRKHQNEGTVRIDVRVIPQKLRKKSAPATPKKPLLKLLGKSSMSGE